MSELLLINPRRRRKVARKRKMPAGLARYWAGKRRAKSSSSPRRRRRRAAVTVLGLGTRKVRRRRVARRRRSVAVAVNPRRRRRSTMRVHRRRVHRNPRFLGGFKGTIKQTLVPAAVGAGGALVLDVVYAKASSYLPASLQTGIAALGVKAIAAVGLGMLAGRFVGKDRAKAGTIGAVTVLVYGAAKTYLMSAVPSLGLSGYQDMTAYPGRPGMGAYMTNKGLGFISPARTLGAYMQQPAPVVAQVPIKSGVHGLDGYDWSNDGM